MSYQIESAASFDRAVKRLAKKYRLIKRDLRGLLDILAGNPFAGDAIPGFAHEVWKIRLASSDRQSGKRGGYRVIYAINQAHEFPRKQHSIRVNSWQTRTKEFPPRMTRIPTKTALNSCKFVKFVAKKNSWRTGRTAKSFGATNVSP